MAKILLFGATGHAGRAIARELYGRGHTVVPVVRNPEKAGTLLRGFERIQQAEVLQPETLKGICDGFDVVVSALGKSVSPTDWSKPSFEEVDFQGNMNILREAQKAGVRQFAYLSAFGAENMRHLTYFRVHDDFSNALKACGLSWAIVQPPAIMSSFLDLAKMARKGLLFTVGEGEHQTNPIAEWDLARVVADTIGGPNTIVAAGGKHVYSRHDINLIIQRLTDPGRKVHKIPAFLMRSALPFWRIFHRNMYDKLAFFNEVIRHDILAPKVGDTSLEEYFTPDKSTPSPI